MQSRQPTRRAAERARQYAERSHAIDACLSLVQILPRSAEYLSLRKQKHPAVLFHDRGALILVDPVDRRKFVAPIPWPHRVEDSARVGVRPGSGLIGRHARIE